MAESLPEELQPAAQYTQEVGPTDDTGKTLSMKEFTTVSTPTLFLLIYFTPSIEKVGSNFFLVSRKEKMESFPCSNINLIFALPWV